MMYETIRVGREAISVANNKLNYIMAKANNTTVAAAAAQVRKLF